jgi:hypothetical protein
VKTDPVAGLADVHDHRRSGFVQLRHLRTVDRPVLLVDLVDKWSDLDSVREVDEYADFTKESVLLNE